MMYLSNKVLFFFVLAGFPLGKFNKLLPYSHNTDTEADREVVPLGCQFWRVLRTALSPHH